jgi:RNA 3'-terminal phosphate cyclase (ATP)
VHEIRDSAGPGNAVVVTLRYEHVTEVCTGFGQRGVPAEAVAEGVAREVQRYLASDAPVGEHLADQVLLPLALAAAQGRAGSYRTLDLTEHSRTHIAVLKKFLPVAIEVDRRATDDVLVSLRPA